MSIPIIDSHIHLFPASHLPTLSWYGPDSPLGSQHCVDEYRHATSSTPTTPDPSSNPANLRANPVYLRGFVFVETDRVSSVKERIRPADEDGDGNGDGWKHVLDEVVLLARIIRGEAVDGDQYRHVDRPDCLGMVPWAPVPGGAGVMERYMRRVKGVTGTDGDVSKKLCGVRYLIQDKPAGVMLQSAFVEGLKWLGREGLTFDLGVDARQGGLGQLREAVEMMERVYEGVDKKDQVVVVIDHLCKPNLRLPYTTPKSITTHADFQEWKTLITTMAQYPKTYMKLSGAFSELPSLPPAPEPDIFSLVERLHPWTDAVFDAFGPERVMFGSDWPVCNLGGGGNDVAWKRWRNVVEGVLERRGLSEEQKRGLWGTVAMRAYGIDAVNM